MKKGDKQNEESISCYFFDILVYILLKFIFYDRAKLFSGAMESFYFRSEARRRGEKNKNVARENDGQSKK